MAFGTTMKPTNATMKEIFTFVARTQSYHFLIAMKDRHYYEDWVYKPLEGLSNYLIQSWVPQPTLLAHPKTKVFFSHGGGNSFIEAVEAHKPILIHPLHAFDQPFNCEFVAMEKLGGCLFKPTADEMVQQLAEIERNNYYQPKLQRLARIMQAKK